MRPVLLLLAALCAALLFSPAVEAGVTVTTDCCVTQAVVVAPPVVVEAPLILHLKTEPVIVAYEAGTRKLTLIEKWKSRRAYRKSLQDVEVATLEPVKSRPRAGKVLGLECVD